MGLCEALLYQLQFCIMASGFVSVGHAGGGNIDYYLRENECVAFKHSINGFGLNEIKADWKQIEYNERLGNRDLGIRGRHDARVRTTYILSMPNELSPAECINRTVNIIDKTAIKDCTWTIAVHKGEADGITNQHVHLLVNERLKSTMKKDRSMQRKEWLAETFRPLFAKEFAKERVKGLTYGWRNRLTVDCYTADKQRARKAIREHNKKYTLGSENLTQSFDKLTVTQERDRLERNRLVRAERSEQSAGNDKKEVPNEFISQNADTSSQESHQRQMALLAHRERLEKEEQRRLDEAEKLKAKADEVEKANKLDWIQKFRSGVTESKAERERLEKEEKLRAEAEKEKQALEQKNKPKEEIKQVEKQQPKIKWKIR